MLIYSGKNISGKRIVTRIQRRNLRARYYDYCGEWEATEKVDDLQADKEDLRAMTTTSFQVCTMEVSECPTDNQNPEIS